MSLNKYTVDHQRDFFKFDERAGDFCFPCVVCVHRDKDQNDEPCGVCAHNINSAAPEQTEVE